MNFFRPCRGGCGRWVRKAGISIASEFCSECQEKMRREFFQDIRARHPIQAEYK